MTATAAAAVQSDTTSAKTTAGRSNYCEYCEYCEYCSDVCEDYGGYGSVHDSSKSERRPKFDDTAVASPWAKDVNQFV
jgi:hypothetical protein